MHLLREGAGTRPGGRGTFLCFAKEKYPKEKRPHDCDPSAQRWGTPAPGHLRGTPWNSLRACGAAFKQPRRVSPRCGCVLRHTRHPASTPAQAQPQGVEAPPNIHTGHCCAWPGWHRRCAPCAVCRVPCAVCRLAFGVWRLAFGVWRADVWPSAAMARVDVRLFWPPPPLLGVPRSAAPGGSGPRAV